MRNTPLTQAHVDANARMVDFHGWNMPVQYAGILDEAERVRTKVGLFDLCHMGRLEITGPDREALVNRVFSGRTAKLNHGRAKYGFLLNEAGLPHRRRAHLPRRRRDAHRDQRDGARHRPRVGRAAGTRRVASTPR